MNRSILRVVKLVCLALALALVVGVLQEFVLCHADHTFIWKRRIPSIWC